jgi:uncharacterized protein YwqG
LQFYIADNDTYGAYLDFENANKQDNFRVLYFANPEFQESNLITDFSFLPKKSDKFPIQGCCSLSFSQSKLAPICYKAIHEIVQDDYSNISESFINEYWELSFSGCSKLGGYPDYIGEFSYTGISPEESTTEYLRTQIEKDPAIILLQIASQYNNVVDIGWGDDGGFDFLISKEDLKTLNFSDIDYYWSPF